MKKAKLSVVLLIFVLALTFTAGSLDASATTKKKSTKTSSSSKTKKTSKTSSKKKSTKKSKKSSSKRRSSGRGHVYSRGSGSTLGEGNALKVIEYAKKFLGIRYSFGSSSTRAFDCSGFTMFVYKEAGIDLPHTASGQANLGLAVSSKNDLKPGDLVFFETYKAGISHVGIYIGNGYFIHASSGAGHVTITSLSDEYYVSRYRGATRILTD